MRPQVPASAQLSGNHCRHVDSKATDGGSVFSTPQNKVQFSKKNGKTGIFTASINCSNFKQHTLCVPAILQQGIIYLQTYIRDFRSIFMINWLTAKSQK